MGIKLSSGLITGTLLTLFCGVSFYLRGVLPQDVVFSGELIKLTSFDAYHQMRIVDSLVHNFPHMLTFDPYLIYPYSGSVGTVHLFNRLVASIAWVIGQGAPTPHTIDMVGIYVPVVLGTLIAIPVYFIGKELFGRGAGVIAAGLLSITAGEFGGRMLLGFVDTPVAEEIITTLFMMFFIMAVKSANQKQITYGHIIRRERVIIAKPLIFSFLAGTFLGIYFLTWTGALLFVFIIAIYFVVQFIIDHLRHQSSDYLVIVGVALIFISLIIFIIFQPGALVHLLQLVSLIIALLLPLILMGISRLVNRWGLKPVYYPLALVVVGLGGLGIYFVISPSLFGDVLSQFHLVFLGGIGTMTLEMMPLFTHGFLIPWANFFTSFPLSIVALCILVYLVIKQGSADKTLLLIWTLVILAASVGQRRFLYYFAVNVSVLVGYLSWLVLWYVGLKHITASLRTQAEKIEGKSLKVALKRKQKRKPQLKMRYVNTALAVIVIFLVVFLPSFRSSRILGQTAEYAPSDAWVNALLWMRDNTPEPFADADFYYKRYPSSKELSAKRMLVPKSVRRSTSYYDYPDSAYGVTAWWDYGYLIIRLAHRLPSTNPSQSPGPITNVAKLFLSPDEVSARDIMQQLDSSYIILDKPTVSSKFWAVINWAEREESDYMEVYIVPREGSLEPIHLYYPKYYRSLAVRLFNFDGKAITPQKALVISFEEKVTEDGRAYKLITSATQYTDYQVALEYVESQKTANYRLVSDSRYQSPIPVEAVQDYRMVYSVDSPDSSSFSRDASSVVKIFEYIRE